jgi:tetratricopeptide (TPR) repeat protein
LSVSLPLALTIRTYFFGEHDDSVGAVLQKMGSLEFQNGEYEKALSMLTEFIRIRQENESENDGDYVNVLFMIGNIHKMQGNEEEAKKWWTDAYDVFQELGLSEGNPQVAQVMDNLLRQENIGQREDVQQKSQGFFGNFADKISNAIQEDSLGLGKLRGNGGQRL